MWTSAREGHHVNRFRTYVYYVIRLFIYNIARSTTTTTTTTTVTVKRFSGRRLLLLSLSSCVDHSNSLQSFRRTRAHVSQFCFGACDDGEQRRAHGANPNTVKNANVFRNGKREGPTGKGATDGDCEMNRKTTGNARVHLFGRTPYPRLYEAYL